MQALCSHAFGWWLERHDGRAKCDPQERSKRTTERVANDPYIRIRVHEGDVVVQILLFFPPWGKVELAATDDLRRSRRGWVLTTPVG